MYKGKSMPTEDEKRGEGRDRGGRTLKSNPFHVADEDLYREKSQSDPNEYQETFVTMEDEEKGLQQREEDH